MAHLICPLCKRELSDGTLDTRLCAQCQALIQTASRSGAVSMAAAPAAAGQQGVEANVQHDALQDNLSLELLDAFEDSSVEDDNFEPDPLFAELFDSQDEFVRSQPNDEQSNYSVHPSEANLLDGPATGSTPGSDEPARQAAELHDVEPESTIIDDPEKSVPDDRAATSIETSIDAARVADSENRFDDLQSIREEVSADPWENALPASEYSRTEWPVLVGPRRGGPFARFKAPIVVLVVLAFAAGIYYLIYRQTSPALVIDSPAPLLPSKVAEPRVSKSPADSAAQNNAPLSSPEATVAAEPKATQPAARDVMTATKENNSAQGKFTLQAAAFPNRAAADEFADKLKAAGVPSYVVSVDLPRRGTWFRVRVGRFNTAEDAQRFVAEAQLRARATGMSLELIVSQY